MRPGAAALLGLTLAALSLSFHPAATEPYSPPVDPSALDNAQALGPFLTTLADLEGGRRNTPIHILQIGDSHTAGDNISGGLRARLQARFGEGGRGVMAPGVPYPALSQRQINVTVSDGWRVEASFPTGYGRFGLSGFRLTSMADGATVGLTADPEARFDRFAFCAQGGPGAGSLGVDTGEVHETIDLNAPAQGTICWSADLAAPASQATLTARGGGPVSLLSYATFRRQPGIAWSALGVVGARLSDFAQRDSAMMASELAAYPPDLIILAFGTNDGFDSDVDIAAYEQLVRQQIRRLKDLAPGAAVLVMGPPDASRTRPDIKLDGIQNKGFDCAPLTDAERADYDQLVEARSPVLARWFEPPNLGPVREAQRRAAIAEGAAFWDWSARMGGPCSSHVLSRPEQDLMRGDHIHFRSEGGDWIAGLLTADLMGAYSARAGGN
ncbi:lysophospholipase L1-like esterase [Caulobacter ginsengisoli]|uniref:Lysophospholipase L1-like esterase n=1 Tax=Caulobacter ginsengisoli TaxID=400775 RepID=A0ABU0IQH0_9CAUL|nr:GDSL-type esterase/lipase family protein [Caulobacter ginsengisoli]MDQ0464262.1 lysophospholipase L1-like esterase [Caulobacter ginsengisoli]